MLILRNRLSVHGVIAKCVEGEMITNNALRKVRTVKECGHVGRKRNLDDVFVLIWERKQFV